MAEVHGIFIEYWRLYDMRVVTVKKIVNRK
jgi:hypothetical protein